MAVEANSNGRLCHQHDTCGKIVEKDIVLRLQKVDILHSEGRKETEIAAYHLFDGIDRCCVRILQRHYAKAFGGALAQVTEVYYAGSKSPMKTKKYQHNMGCCLASIISDFLSEQESSSKVISTFLSKMSREEACDEEIVFPCNGENASAIENVWW